MKTSTPVLDVALPQDEQDFERFYRELYHGLAAYLRTWEGKQTEFMLELFLPWWMEKAADEITFKERVIGLLFLLSSSEEFVFFDSEERRQIAKIAPHWQRTLALGVG